MNDCTQEIQIDLKRNNCIFDGDIYSITGTSMFKALSERNFEKYKSRLGDLIELGRTEFNIMNKELLGIANKYSAEKYSFSCTSDPSLHFTIKFPDSVTLYVESFLETGMTDSYFLIYENGEILEDQDGIFDSLLLKLKSCLDRILITSKKKLPSIDELSGTIN